MKKEAKQTKPTGKATTAQPDGKPPNAQEDKATDDLSGRVSPLMRALYRAEEKKDDN